MRRPRRSNRTPLLALFISALAWAGSGTTFIHTPFLFNRTAGATEVRITWVLQIIPCATTPEALAATLGPSDLDDARVATLDSGETATLGGPPPAGTSPAGVCADEHRAATAQGQNCRAAILETAGATPVLMIAPTNWQTDSRGYICDPGPSPKSRCAPKLDPATDGGDEALALVSRNGVLVFEVSHPGAVDRSIRIGPVDPAAIASRPVTSAGCRQARDAYRTLAQSTACASDDDCQAIPGLAIQGEATGCTLFVNNTVSAASVDVVKAQWTAGLCASGETACRPPLGVVCRAGTCGELCAGVPLPTCETSCDYYAKDPNGVCNTYFFDCSGSGEQCHPTCTDANLQRCVCRNDKFVCEPRPLIDPTCPLPCR